MTFHFSTLCFLLTQSTTSFHPPALLPAPLRFLSTCVTFTPLFLPSTCCNSFRSCTWASQSLLDGLVFLTSSPIVKSLSLWIDIGFWVSFLELCLVLVVQCLLSPYSWSSSKVMRLHPAHLPFWKAAILSERQPAYPKPQLSGFIT